MGSFSYIHTNMAHRVTIHPNWWGGFYKLSYSCFALCNVTNSGLLKARQGPAAAPESWLQMQGPQASPQT